MAYKRKKKRTLTPEQIAKMQEGRERAKKAKEDALKTRERVKMLSELDEQLAAGRRAAKSDFRPHSHRRHRNRSVK